ncbi:MAG: putative DNA binding domain-containing protein, partial [Lentisphaeria bacterium]|nr:putative DNA binding domain-containing protein [Lentisphaeria bacterium]
MKESQNIEWKETWNDEYLKWICGFANAQGGKIYLGIKDDGSVCGVKNAKKLLEDIPNKIVTTLGIVAEVNLLKKDALDYIEIIVVPSSLPIAYHGIYHYRSGSTKQELRGTALQNFLLKKMGVSWDDASQEMAVIDMLSPDAIEYFQRKSIANKRMSPESYTTDMQRVLENLRLIDDNGHLKNAALLLFGKDPARYFPLCDFRIGRFIGNEANLLFQDVVGGDIIRMADRVMDILKSKYLTSPIHYEGLQRIEPLEIPEEALREAIFNAIIHKDYTGVHIQMRVYNDRIELWNQGKLPEELPPEKLFERHSSYPRNKNIAEVFYRAGFIESWGRGIRKIVDAVKKAGLTEPEIEDAEGGVRITIFRKGYNPAPEITLPHKKSKVKSKVKILELICKNPQIPIHMIAEAIGLSVGGVEKNIRQLKKDGILT